MNRTHRRALARAMKDVATREALGQAKLTHRLPAQVCTLWVPACKGYVSEFSPRSFRLVDLADLARHYNEDDASSAALAFREVTGLRVIVRPVHVPQFAAA